MHRSGTAARAQRWLLALTAAVAMSSLAIIGGLFIQTLVDRDQQIAEMELRADGQSGEAPNSAGGASPAEAPADLAPDSRSDSTAVPDGSASPDGDANGASTEGSNAAGATPDPAAGHSDDEGASAGDIAARPLRAPQGWLLTQIWKALDGKPLSTATLAHAAGGVVLLMAVLWLFIGRGAEYEAQHVVDRLRNEIREQAFNDGGNDLLGEPTRPEELLLDHCESLRAGLAGVWQTAPRALLGGLALLTVAALTDPWITLLGMLLFSLLWWAWRHLESAADERAHSLHGAAAQSESLLLESLRLAPLTASFSLNEAPGRPFTKILADHRSFERQSHLVRGALGALRMVLIAIGLWALLLVFGLTDRLSLADGVLLAVAALGAQALVRQTLNLIPRVERADTAAHAIFDYLKQQPPLAESKAPRRVERLSQAVRFENVTLEDRGGRRVLDRASCELPRPAANRHCFVRSAGAGRAGRPLRPALRPTGRVCAVRWHRLARLGPQAASWPNRRGHRRCPVVYRIRVGKHQLRLSLHRRRDPGCRPGGGGRRADP